MIRAVRISLGEITQSKRQRLDAVLRELRTAANFYSKSLWEQRGKLDSKTFKRYQNGNLRARQKTAMLKLALDNVVACRKRINGIHQRVHCPTFRKAIPLSKLICSIEKGKGSFDFVMKVTSMVARHPLVLPFKSHARLNYWLKKGGKILNGAILAPPAAWIYIELPDEPSKTEGKTIGLDVGVNKLIADSNGQFHGTEMKSICANIRRKKPVSLAKKRACAERQNYVNFVCRRLPWQTTKT